MEMLLPWETVVTYSKELDQVQRLKVEAHLLLEHMALQDILRVT